MRRLCLILMLWAIPLYADDPPTPAPGIRLPELPSATPITPVIPDTIPAPPREPATTIHKLTPDLLYVFDTDVDVVVTSSPLGLIKVNGEPGPLRIRGKFVGNENISTRNYKGKMVYTVDPVKSGRVELIIVPIGAKTESELIRRTLDVETGVPPDPKPPGPKPVDPPPAPTKELRVLFVYESASALTREENNILNSLQLRKYLDAKTIKDGNTPGYRFWDKDIDTSQELPVWKEIWAATKPSLGKLPTVVIFSGTDGKNYPLSTVDDKGKVTTISETALLELLQKYGGK